MYTLKIVTTFFDVVLATIIFLFCRGFKWNKQSDRPTIVGFSLMIACYLANIFCMWGGAIG